MILVVMVMGLLRPKKSCVSCCRLVKNRDGGVEFFFLFYDKTFRVELAAQECGF